MADAGFAASAGHCDTGDSVSVRSPSAIPAAVASTGLPSLHAASAQWYFSHPGVRFRPIDGTSCEVAVTTRPHHRRELVETLRQGDLADAPTAGMGNAPPRPGPADDVDRLVVVGVAHGAFSALSFVKG